jgi:Domain of unknown function (DUF222)
VIVDQLAPGPGLAAWLANADPAGFSDRDLPGVAAAWRRVASWAQARELATVASMASRAAARDPKAGTDADGRPARVTAGAASEVSLALTMSQFGASCWAQLGVTLRWRLPETGAALDAGQITLPQARLIAEATARLEEEAARAVQDRVLPGAGRLTPGQLRDALRRAVIRVDPQGADHRRRDAERAAKVSLYPDEDGTAALIGSRLPGVHAAAAMARIAALARGLKAAGAGGGLNLLKAQVMIGLILGTLPLIDPPPGTPPDNDGPPGGDGPDRDEPPGDAGPDRDDPQHHGGPPGYEAPPDRDDPPDGAGPGSGPGQGSGPGPGPGGGGSGPHGPRDGREPGPGRAGAPGGSGNRPRARQQPPDQPGSGPPRSRPPGSAPGRGDPGDPDRPKPGENPPPERPPPVDGLAPDDPPLPEGPLPPDDGLRPDTGPLPGDEDAVSPGPPARLRWLTEEDRLDEHPTGEIIAAWPPLPATISQLPPALGQPPADPAASAMPGITGGTVPPPHAWLPAAAAGAAAAVARALGRPGTGRKTGPGGDRGSSSAAGPGTRRPPPGLLELITPWTVLTGAARGPSRLGRIGPITAEQALPLARLAAFDPCAQWRVILTDADGRAIAVERVSRRRARTGRRGRRGTREPAAPGVVGRVTVTMAVTALSGPGPAPDHGIRAAIWRAARRAARRAEKTRAADAAAPGGCAHTTASRSYRPPPRIREYVQARDQTGRQPYCRQPAWHTDLDHTLAFHKGGPTCPCNLGGGCRTHHQVKQLPGWTLTQPRPGYFELTTPAGRTYLTSPDTYDI